VSAPLSDYDAVRIAEGSIECDDDNRLRAAWQHLHDTGLGYRLEGWFGRTLRDLIDAGEVTTASPSNPNPNPQEN